MKGEMDEPVKDKLGVFDPSELQSRMKWATVEK